MRSQHDKQHVKYSEKFITEHLDDVCSYLLEISIFQIEQTLAHELIMDPSQFEFSGQAIAQVSVAVVR